MLTSASSMFLKEAVSITLLLLLTCTLNEESLSKIELITNFGIVISPSKGIIFSHET